ncbi:hypothetical protein Baya_7364 [Bagarius yarrelli]|uniref:Uncharacterized protein n=1 Tax=Bagarius yarrelli TaxID=175774 RepID=A0A556U1T8_BAGYA|nr:hypothetical protein Baya_7364 [Bagarius yarrelli]
MMAAKKATYKPCVFPCPWNSPQSAWLLSGNQLSYTNMTDLKERGRQRGGDSSKVDPEAVCELHRAANFPLRVEEKPAENKEEVKSE